MPLVKIEIRKGKSSKYKKTLLDTVHESLVEAFNIPENDRMQRLYELELSNFETKNGTADNFILIELLVFKGRNIQAKRNLYKAIVTNLEDSLGINGSDVLIVINEQPLENWGIRGGKCAKDIDLGFDVNV